MSREAGGSVIDRSDLLLIFEQTANNDADYVSWLQFLRTNAPAAFPLKPVTGDHLVGVYGPRLSRLEEKSSSLAPALSRVVHSMVARSAEVLNGILFVTPDSGIGYMAWLDQGKCELVAYFVSRPEQRSVENNR